MRVSFDFKSNLDELLGCFVSTVTVLFHLQQQRIKSYLFDKFIALLHLEGSVLK